MPIKIRHQKNRLRGTELTYATIPIDEANKVTNEEVDGELCALLGVRPREKGRTFGAFCVELEPYENGKLKKRDDSQPTNGNASDLIKYFADNPVPEMIIRLDQCTTPEKARYTYVTMRKTGEKIAITPTPLIHSIRTESYGYRALTEAGLEVDSYSALLNILREGFKSDGSTSENAYLKHSKNHRGNIYSTESSREDITSGDVYHLELFSQKAREENPMHAPSNFILYHANPENILSVNIEIDPSLSKEEQEKKMQFYRENVAQKYALPVKFFKKGKTGRNVSRSSKRFLEDHIFASVAIVGLLGSLFFTSSTFTGNVTGSLTQNSTNIIGVILFLVGIVASFFYVRKSKHL